jgi:hypothetical protein
MSWIVLIVPVIGNWGLPLIWDLKIVIWNLKRFGAIEDDPFLIVMG